MNDKADELLLLLLLFLVIKYRIKIAGHLVKTVEVGYLCFMS